jgi:hypothetical protein
MARQAPTTDASSTAAVAVTAAVARTPSGSGEQEMGDLRGSAVPPATAVMAEVEGGLGAVSLSSGPAPRPIGNDDGEPALPPPELLLKVRLEAFKVELSKPKLSVVGPVSYCSPRHRMPWHSRNEG